MTVNGASIRCGTGWPRSTVRLRYPQIKRRQRRRYDRGNQIRRVSGRPADTQINWQQRDFKKKKNSPGPTGGTRPDAICSSPTGGTRPKRVDVLTRNWNVSTRTKPLDGTFTFRNNNLIDTSDSQRHLSAAGDNSPAAPAAESDPPESVIRNSSAPPTQ